MFIMMIRPVIWFVVFLAAVATGVVVYANYKKGVEIAALCGELGGVVVQTKDGVYLCAPRANPPRQTSI